MKIKLLLSFLCATIFGQAQITFQKTYGGGTDIGNSTQQTFDGGYIITGYTTSFGAGGLDVYLIKTNVNGDTLWTRTFGGTNHEVGNSVKQTSDSGYVVVGYSKSFGAGQEDVFLLKTNSIGNVIWTKTIGGTNQDIGYSVQQTTDGGYIILGTTYSFGVGSTNGYSDLYLIKTNSTGDTLWTKTFGGTGLVNGYDVKQTSDGGYILTGSVGDVCLIKLNSSGSVVWSKKFGGGNADFGNSVQQTSDGGYVSVGYTLSFGTGLQDVYLIKTNSTGSLQWSRTYGGTGNDRGNFVQQTSDGGYIITGYTASFGAGNWDMYLIKTDIIGDTLWTKTCGGINMDAGYSVMQTTDGGYSVVGTYNNYIYLVKADSNGNSGCNQNNTQTIVTAPSTISASPLHCENFIHRRKNI